MLETALLSIGCAVIVSVAVVFASSWEQRIRLRRLEVQLAEWEERLVREVKQRAAAASVAARGAAKLNPIDEALIRQHASGGGGDGDAPWWDKLLK